MATTSRRIRSGRPVSTTKSRKVVEKLQQKIEDGSFYEAHQTYKALYQRFCAQGSEEQAISLLLEGASTLLKHEQWESGTDLGLMFVNHLKSKHSPITEDTLDTISQLFGLYKPPTLHRDPPSSILPPEIDPREIFMRAALKWSSMVGGEECRFGHPHLHKMLALSYWEGKQYARARDHFQYACQPEDYALMLVEVASIHGHPNEADLFLTQAVLQLLVLRNRRSAMGVYSIYTQTHPAFRTTDGPPYQDGALLNFTWFLLLSTESGDGEVFNFLREQYCNTLSRDPCFDDYLDKIGAAYFGIKQHPDKAPGISIAAGGLGGLLELLGGGAGGGPEGGGFLGSLMSGLSGMEQAPLPTFSLVSDPPQASFSGAMMQSVDIVD